MANRYLSLALATGLASVSLLAGPSLGVAQTRTPEKPQLRAIPEAPAVLPAPSRDRNRGIEFLLGALKVAPDAESARHVEARVWAFWSHTTSDTTALLMSRARAAVQASDTGAALNLLNSLVKLKPDYIEGWNRRATLFYMNNRPADALRDLEQVLVREPRHFGALVGVGMIMQELGDERRALDAYRRAVAINPQLEKVPEIIKNLTEKVEGRDI